MFLTARSEKMDNPKLDKYDDAFLFSLGLVGLIISFIEIGKNSITETASAIPFLLLGILLPFIVGYLRGAIQQNSIEERMRGWIYFLIGTTSYFAFFVILRMSSYNYWVREGVFIFIIVIGVITAYEFINWSRRLFNVRNPLDSYAFSATALGVFGFSILFSLFVGMFFDFQVNDIWEKIRASFTEQLFWFSIFLFLISMVLIFEKGSRCAIQNELKLQKEHELIVKYPLQLRGIWNFFPIKGLFLVFLGLVLFEYSFDFNLEVRNLQARTLWIHSFVSWSIGCLLWKTGSSSVASLFFAMTIISSTFAVILFYKSQIYDFRGIDKVLPFKIGYILGLFVLMSLVVLGGNISQLVVAIVLWTLVGVIRIGSIHAKRVVGRIT
jgi:hypothetical protein